jgi:hypothetical protein
VKFEVPKIVPAGEVNLQITISPARDKWPDWNELLEFKGFLKDSSVFEGDLSASSLPHYITFVNVADRVRMVITSDS